MVKSFVIKESVHLRYYLRAAISHTDMISKILKCHKKPSVFLQCNQISNASTMGPHPMHQAFLTTPIGSHFLLPDECLWLGGEI